MTTPPPSSARAAPHARTSSQTTANRAHISSARVPGNGSGRTGPRNDYQSSKENTPVPGEEHASTKPTERSHKTASEVRTERSHVTTREAVHMRTKRPAKDSSSRADYEKTKPKKFPPPDVISPPVRTRDKGQPAGQWPAATAEEYHMKLI